VSGPNGRARPLQRSDHEAGDGRQQAGGHGRAAGRERRGPPLPLSPRLVRLFMAVAGTRGGYLFISIDPEPKKISENCFRKSPASSECAFLVALFFFGGAVIWGAVCVCVFYLRAVWTLCDYKRSGRYREGVLKNKFVVGVLWLQFCKHF